MLGDVYERLHRLDDAVTAWEEFARFGGQDGDVLARLRRARDELALQRGQRSADFGRFRVFADPAVEQDAVAAAARDALGRVRGAVGVLRRRAARAAGGGALRGAGVLLARVRPRLGRRRVRREDPRLRRSREAWAPEGSCRTSWRTRSSAAPRPTGRPPGCTRGSRSGSRAGACPGPRSSRPSAAGPRRRCRRSTHCSPRAGRARRRGRATRRRCFSSSTSCGRAARERSPASWRVSGARADFDDALRAETGIGGGAGGGVEEGGSVGAVGRIR